MVPKKPVSHGQPEGTFDPVEAAGHDTAAHVPLKKGLEPVAVTEPE